MTKDYFIGGRSALLRPLLLFFTGGGGGFLAGEAGPLLCCTGNDTKAGLFGGRGFDGADKGKLDSAAGGLGGGRDGDFTGDNTCRSC